VCFPVTIGSGGGGNTARNSQGQTAREATYDGNPNTGTSQGYSQHYADGGRAGYFFGGRARLQNGGRARYAEGGPIYSRLGTLNSGVQSAEQQLQSINASLQKAESDLGGESSGGGSSLSGGPSFTSNFQDANNQGPGSNLLFGGSMDQDSPSTAPTTNTFVPEESPTTNSFGGPLQQLQTANPISSIGGNTMPATPSTGGVQGTLSTQSNEGLTGEELVNNIQMRMQQRDVKMPSFNAYAQDVMKTGGYPTKQIEDYSDLDPVGSGPKQLPSAGGGLGGLFGGNSAPSTNLPESGAPQAGDVVYDPTGMPNIFSPRIGQGLGSIL
jgi:hypothetical protein